MASSLVIQLRRKINAALAAGKTMVWVAEKTGCSRPWLILIRDDMIENPGTSRVERAISSLTSEGF